MQNKIVFRADSSLQIATGHIMRCLALANKLKNTKEIIFICRNLDGNIIDRIKQEGFQIKLLPAPTGNLNSANQYENWLAVPWKQDLGETKEILVDLGEDITLIIDHYGLDEKWELAIKNYVNKIIVIDDLANRKHHCNIIIDQNLYHNYQNRYNNLVPKNCRRFLGPEYTILREQFYQIKKRKRAEIKNILVFFGGIDADNLSLKSIEAIIKAQKNGFEFNIKIIGGKNNHQQQIKNICQINEFDYHDYVDNMAEIMNWTDLAIGAGGTTTWERCLLNLPAIVISLADNQVEICKNLDNLGIIKYLGISQNITQELIASSLIEVCNNFNFKMLDYSPKIDELIENIA